MNGKILFGFAMFLLIGVAIGGKVTTLAYKPILVAQAIEIYQLEEDKIEFIERYKFLEVEIEAHQQDMEQFISKSTLIKVLKQLGIII